MDSARREPLLIAMTKIPAPKTRVIERLDVNTHSRPVVNTAQPIQIAVTQISATALKLVKMDLAFPAHLCTVTTKIPAPKIPAIL